MSVNRTKPRCSDKVDRPVVAGPGSSPAPAEPDPEPVDYRLVFESAADAILVTDAQGRYVDANPRACELTGYRRDELLMMSVGDLCLSSDRSYSQERFDLLRKLGQTRQDRCLIRKDGTQVIVEAFATALGNGMYQTMLRDVSKRVEIAEKLHDALQRLQFHVKRMPLAYIVWDTGFRAIEWNPAAERMFGYSKLEAIGQHAYDLVVPADAIPAVDEIWDELLKGDTSSHSINANVRKDGSRLTCEWFNTPLRDPEGRIQGVASMAMDVVEREAMDAQLRDAQKLDSLGVLAGGVAHDFNSSLMVILGNASLLRSLPRLPAKATEYVELIEDAGLRAGEFISHLLAYARTGRHNPQPTGLNQLLEEASTFVQSAIGKRHEVVFKLADRLPSVLADRSQIEQIVLNLCLNAKQAQPEGGAIVISTRRTTLAEKRASQCVPHPATPGRYVEMVVEDDGCGMDETTIKRIFDPFFSTKHDGHGLGLAAALGILRQHRAFTYVESKPGKGTKFHILLPVHRVSSSEKAAKAK